MNSRAEFWSAVDAELDARREPFASVDVRAWVLEHPEDALELADMRAALRETERADNPLRAPRTSRLAPLAAATGLALAALGASLAVPARSPIEELELHPVVSRPELGSVQTWEVVSSCTTSEGTVTVRASEGRIETENDFILRTSAVAQAEAPTIHEESWRAR